MEQRWLDYSLAFQEYGFSFLFNAETFIHTNLFSTKLVRHRCIRTCTAEIHQYKRGECKDYIDTSRYHLKEECNRPQTFPIKEILVEVK